MILQLARPFFDLFWLNGTLNWGQISNSFQNEKQGILDVYTMVAVYSSSVEQNRSRRFEKRAFRKREKFILSWLGRGERIDMRTYTRLLRIPA